MCRSFPTGIMHPGHEDPAHVAPHSSGSRAGQAPASRSCVMVRSGSLWRSATPSLASLPVRLVGSGGLALLALIAANAIWGGSPSASKAAMGEFGPLTVGAGRAG